MSLDKRVIEFAYAMTEEQHLLHDVIHDLFLPTGVIECPTGLCVGLQASAQELEKWPCAFPDFHTKSIKTKMISNKVFVKWTVGGTHFNPIFGVDATYKKLTFTGMSEWTFNANGQIESLNYVIDMANIFNQLGFHLRKESYPGQSWEKDNSTALLNHLRTECGTHKKLTRQEIICLSLYYQGFSAKHSAKVLGSSFRTIEKHIARALSKIDCHSKSQVTEWVKSKQLGHIMRDFTELILEV